jgi:hypothetical protein
MKKELAMRLFSRRSLTDSAARKQITALSDFALGMMRPDKCSDSEPIRTPFDPNDISAPIRWLAKPHGRFFYRKGRPVNLCGEMWNLARPQTARFGSPRFINYWTGQFDGNWAHQISVEKVEDFVAEMFRVTDSDFGFLTAEIDLRAKNRVPNSYSYVGMDPATGIPGLYWINFFSAGYAEWLGLGQFRQELAPLRSLPEGGVSIKFCESPDHCRDLDVLQKQRAVVEWLGPEKFFDIRFPDREAVTPDWHHLPLRDPQPAP